MDPVKIASVTKWPALTNKKEVQSFLGFTNFYRRFIKDFSEHARPLFDLRLLGTCPPALRSDPKRLPLALGRS